jgi:hypothetical protein
MATRPESKSTLGSTNEPLFEVKGICHKCERYHNDAKCDAFPRGIPAEVLVGDFLHTQEYPGDHGLQFRPKQ